MVWGRCVVRGRFRSIPFTRSTLHTILEITSADILVEDCAVSTLESVLLAILMAEVVDLKKKISYKLSHCSKCSNITSQPASASA